MGKVHPRHQTPHQAVAAAVVLIPILCLLLSGLPTVDASGVAGTFGTFGFLVIYLLICIVAPVDLRRDGLLRLRHVCIGGIGVLLMLFVIGGSLYPVPDYPYNLLPYIFAAYLALGAVWFTTRSARRQATVLSMQDDMET